MKRVLNIVAIIAIILLFGKMGYIETHYSLTGEIIACKNNIMLICDTNGDLWEYDQIDSLTTGDKVNMIMWDNTTLSKIDDEIVKIELQGR